MKKSNIIDNLTARLAALEEKKTEAKEDEETCPECGSDLYYVEEGVVFCVKCKQYYEVE